jgi:DNA-binding NarL/FixJ family response regulator
MSAMEDSGSDRRRGGPDRRGPGEKTKILIVDDHALFRVGIHYVLDKEDDFEVVGEADDGRSAFDAVVETSPDIILMGLSLPAPGGIETTQRIKRELPSAGMVVLAVSEDEDALFEAIKAGAAAFILKDVGPDDLVTIIRRGSRSASTSSTTRSSPSRPSPAASSRSFASWRSTARRPPRSSRRSPRARCRSWTTSPRA